MPVEIADDRLVIEQSKGRFALVAFSLITGAFAFGFFFYYRGISDGLTPAAVFGAVFLAVGLIALLAVIRQLQSLRDRGGLPVLTADREGLDVAAAPGMSPERFSWAEIERVVLADRLIRRNGRDSGETRNAAAFYLVSKTPYGLMERGQRDIWRSGDGRDVVQVHLPGAALAEVETALRRLAPRSVDVKLCDRVEFDVEAGEDRLDPA